ncbi:trace amine-associated receptor 7d-like [Sphaeramia orbicularis]|uniref:trace amine-associated receptor 7d-like n=1 Tax=Sphaeramia orbicularis TaxID=375764 RepID=UPI00118039C1|nr:trace amine-associated receptor 7d-like [Sphaeramia orbicularis]
METHEGAELCFPELLNASCLKPMVSQTEVLVYHILLFIFSPLTVALNLVVIISVAHFRQLHTPTNLLLLSLAVSDLLVGLVLMPAEIHLKLSCWFLGDSMCSMYIFFAWLSVSASVGDMVLISVDRYVAICDPLHYTHKVTARAMRSHIASITAQRSGKAVANKSELKAARSLGVLVVVFLICFCPYYIVTLINTSFIPSLFFFMTFFMYLNSCVNPLIYALFYPWFRKAVRLIFTLQILQSGSCDSTMSPLTSLVLLVPSLLGPCQHQLLLRTVRDVITTSSIRRPDCVQPFQLFLSTSLRGHSSRVGSSHKAKTRIIQRPTTYSSTIRLTCCMLPSCNT